MNRKVNDTIECAVPCFLLFSCVWRFGRGRIASSTLAWSRVWPSPACRYCQASTRIPVNSLNVINFCFPERVDRVGCGCNTTLCYIVRIHTSAKQLQDLCSSKSQQDRVWKAIAGVHGKMKRVPPSPSICRVAILWTQQYWSGCASFKQKAIIFL